MQPPSMQPPSEWALAPRPPSPLTSPRSLPATITGVWSFGSCDMGHRGDKERVSSLVGAVLREEMRDPDAEPEVR